MASRDHRGQAVGAPPGRPTDPTGTPDPDRPAWRRRDLIGAAAGVTAVSLAAMASPAAAQTPGSSPGTTAAVGASGGAGAAAAEPPTVEGPDLVLVRFLRSVELSLVEVYDAALDSGKFKTAATDFAHVARSHHHDHAERMADFGGSESPNTPNRGLSASLLPRVGAADSETALIAVLQNAEESAAATYQWAVGEADDWQLASAVGSIGPVDAQHATAWNRVAIPDDRLWAMQIERALPVNQTTDGRWEIAQYPVGAA